jgi:hypothetical protein
VSNTTAAHQWAGIDISEPSLDMFVQPTGAHWQVTHGTAHVDALVEQFLSIWRSFPLGGVC